MFDLVEYIENRGGTISVSQLGRGPVRFRGEGRANMALMDLVAAGLGRFEYSSGSPKGGRPKKVFALGRKREAHDREFCPGSHLAVVLANERRKVVERNTRNRFFGAIPIDRYRKHLSANWSGGRDAFCVICKIGIGWKSPADAKRNQHGFRCTVHRAWRRYPSPGVL